MSSSDSPVAGGPDPGFRRRPGKEPERSNFSQTCNLLSQYFNQRGPLGVTDNKAVCDSSAAAAATAMDLLPNTPKPTQAAPGTRMNLLPNRGKSDGSPGLKGPVGKAEFRKPAERGPTMAQMTIFYAGKVIVYNDFPADKARDIMGEAEKHSSSYCVSRTTEVAKIKFRSAIVSDSNIVSVPEMKKSAAMGQPRPNGSHLPIPIATRSSLHRFFSKRKDRAAAKAPYQVNRRDNAHLPEEGQNNDRSSDIVEILGSESLKEPTPAPEVKMLEGQSSKQFIDLNL